MPCEGAETLFCEGTGRLCLVRVHGDCVLCKGTGRLCLVRVQGDCAL